MRSQSLRSGRDAEQKRRTAIPVEETTTANTGTALARKGEAWLYHATSKFRFHGPDGFEADYAGLTRYFESIRAAFDDRSIRRGIIVAEGNYIACQT